MKQRIDTDRNRLVCAFCTHWYDPGNTHITPINQRMGRWEFDTDVKSYCDFTRREEKSQSFCGKFERKIPKR